VALILLRHTPVVAEPGLCYGALDLPVRPHDLAACASRVAQEAERVPVGLWTSPRQRCTALAAVLAPHWPNCRAIERSELAEMDFGVWEGQRWDTVGAAEIDRWMTDFAHHAPGGGESVGAFLLRVHAALAEVLPLAQRGDWVWVTHAGVVRAVVWWLAGARDARRAEQVSAGEWPDFAVEPGSTLCLEPQRFLHWLPSANRKVSAKAVAA
jgi:alpha-ribazole phosphatase